MATLALQYAGAAVGGLVGGPLGAVLGRAGGAIAGSFVDNALFGSKPKRIDGPRLNDTRVMGSTEGAPIPRLWGRSRLSGQLIWATNFVEELSKRADGRGGKGSPKPKTVVTEAHYYANFAVALCEGPITSVSRCWADGKPFELSGVTWRLYTGDESQQPDSLISAKMGWELTPAFRGTAYIVFEHFALERFGNRLPQLSFEVTRGISSAAAAVRGVALIPGSTEFGYDTRLVTQRPSRSVTLPENMHMSNTRSDLTVSLDHLQGVCPGVQSVSLVVAWFGTSVKCAQCSLRPAVERHDKITKPDNWFVAGLARNNAPRVSTYAGSPAYGGTPSDGSVVRAIQNLKARGLRVLFNPFILMDIPAGGSEPSYPWRGRVSCFPKPGEWGSPDLSAAAAAQVQAFSGNAQPWHFSLSRGQVKYSGPDEWSYRRMILHYAYLCALAGGVDAFLIGSEMIGMSQVRSGRTDYPFVTVLQELAAQVKAILPGTKISYGADWSEYFGHHPADGSNDHIFNLDPLWASSAISFIGIDSYIPLADWREGESHLDRAGGAHSIYDVEYLKGNIAGGEGYHWYYANPSARSAQIRSPITDSAVGKPWVFRCKDLLGWWSNPHYNRINGVEVASPTGWVPRSKPFWLTEAGCAAIDKGANQPNAFFDEKSTETLAPYFSSTLRDDAVQSAVISALMIYWSASGPHNPVSPLYGAPMLSAANIHLWAWDARPFPAFPALSDLWADSANYARGHWLNGRIEAMTLGDLVRAICREAGLGWVAIEGLHQTITGYVADRITSARGLLEPLAQCFHFSVVESDGVLKFRDHDRSTSLTVEADDFAERPRNHPLYELAREQETELPNAIKLGFMEEARDYRTSVVEARRLQGQSLRTSLVELPCVLGHAAAFTRADSMIQRAWTERDTARFSLPRRYAGLEVGDIISLLINGRTHTVRLQSVMDSDCRQFVACRHDGGIFTIAAAPDEAASCIAVRPLGPPEVLALDLAVDGGTLTGFAPWIGACANPWPGRMVLLRKQGDSFNFDQTIEAPAIMGTLLDPLPRGTATLWDRASRVRVELFGGTLQSVSELSQLAGGNVAVIGNEIVSFRQAILTSPNIYELRIFLRALRGSGPEMLDPAPAGTSFMMLDDAVVQSALSLGEARSSVTWRIGPEGRDPADPSWLEFTMTPSARGLRPLSVTHVQARRNPDGIALSWVRRTRIDGDSWEIVEVPLGEEAEEYRIEILEGGAVKRTLTSIVTRILYPPDLELADFGAPVQTLALRIFQISRAVGPGAPFKGTFHV